MANLDRLLRDGKWGAISTVEFLDLVVDHSFIVPTRTAMDGQLSGFDPLVLDQDGTHMIGVFSNRDLAGKFRDQAPHIAQINAWDLIKALKPDFGILLNPGEEFSFTFAPAGLAEMRRIRGAF